MNSYEQYQEDKKLRLLEKAKNLRDAANQKRQSSFDNISGLPAGQPILIGHHSEKKHRRLLERSDNLMIKAKELDEQAEQLEYKANAIGSTNVISTNDPDALKKLKARLDFLTRDHAAKLEIDKLYRKNKSVGFTDLLNQMNIIFERYNLEKIDINGKDIKRHIEINISFYGKPCATLYEAKKIKELKNRIKLLENRQEKNDQYIKYPSYEARFCYKESQIRFTFESKPDLQVIKLLKAKGMKWSPSKGEWVRKMTDNAFSQAKELVTALETIYDETVVEKVTG